MRNGLGDLAINRHTHEGEEITATLLMDRDVSSDLRIREVVKLERASGDGELLANASATPAGD